MTPTQLAGRRGHFDAAYFRALLDQLGWNQNQAADAIGVSLRTINSYANTDEHIPKLVFLYLELRVKHEPEKGRRRPNPTSPQGRSHHSG